jgi:outer membrane immunogenic protein
LRHFRNTFTQNSNLEVGRAGACSGCMQQRPAVFDHVGPAMRRFAGIATLTATTVPAADLAWALPEHAFTWSGCYVGVNAGYAWGSSNVTFTETGSFLANPPADVAFSDRFGSPNPRHERVHWRRPRRVQSSNRDFRVRRRGRWRVPRPEPRRAATGNIPVGGTAVSMSASVSTHSLFTVRPRAGFAMDGMFFYATGGYAAGNVTYNEWVTHSLGHSFIAGTASALRSGWTVGGGIEYAVTNHWTIKGEYLYVDLGTVGFNAANDLVPTFTSVNTATFKENIVHFGGNYKF